MEEANAATADDTRTEAERVSRRQKKQIAQLEARVEALEAKLGLTPPTVAKKRGKPLEANA